MFQRSALGYAVAWTTVSALALQACVHKSESTSGPSPAESTVQAPIPVVVVPIPVAPPQAPPAATPVPPTATPAPTPDHTRLPPGVTPDPSQVREFCSPWIPPDGYHCPRNPNPVYVQPLNDAALKLMRDQPGIFRDSLVLDAVAYYNGMFKNLYELGYCATMDSNEVAISDRGNDRYRENYQILSSAGMVRRSAAAHVSACAR
jgi:hypothetical protein